jgi:hypothetical protein
MPEVVEQLIVRSLFSMALKKLPRVADRMMRPMLNERPHFVWFLWHKTPVALKPMLSGSNGAREQGCIESE